MDTRPSLDEELKESYCKRVEKEFGVDRKKQPKLFRLGSFALPLFLLTKQYCLKLLHNISTLALTLLLVPIGISVPGGLTNLTYVSTELLASALTERIEYIRSGEPTGRGGLACRQFNPEEWEEKQGHLFFDNSRWILPSDELNGIWYFEDRIALDTDIMISFLTLSHSQMNFVITMDGLYELIIGDGDYRRASLKVWDGKKFVPISDTEGREYIPFSDGDVEPGIDTKVFVDQDFSQLEDGSYIVSIQLAQDAFLDRERSPSTFATYEFALPKIRYKDGETALGLGLRTASDGTEVSAEVWCVDFF